MTLRELLREGGRRLLAADVPGAENDARILLYDAFGIDTASYLRMADDAAPEEGLRKYRTYIGAREMRKPLQYITGKADFYGLTFRCAPDVLIPRFDSETLVARAAEKAGGNMRVLDLCTGTGCLLLTLMHLVPGLWGAGSDISEKALALAAENARSLGLPARIFKADLFAPADEDGCAIMEKGFDMILCNPPYIAEAAMAGLDPEVREHEDPGALCGGPDGLAFYRRIIPEAPAHLLPGGWLFLEIGYDQAESVMDLMKENGFRDVAVSKDLAGRDRVIQGIWNV